MSYDSSTLFDNDGHIPLKEYVLDIEEMRKHGPWKLPLGTGDRFHLVALSIFSKFSWFSDKMYIKQGKSFGPAYSMLLSYLHKNQLYDVIFDRSEQRRGLHSFVLEKKMEVEGKKIIIRGQGVACDRVTALSAAIGEMVERAITGLHDKNKKVTHASFEQLEVAGKQAVYPPKFHRFLEVQKAKYPQLRFDQGTTIAWVKGQNLTSKETVYIPKKMTSWIKEHKGKEMFVEATTNGSAGYFSKDEATLRGMLEVVERDGFLVHWLTKIAPDIIEQESLPKDLQEELRRFQDKGISLYLLNTTSLGIPTVTLVAIGTSVTNESQVVVSGGCAITFKEGIEKAVNELVVPLEMLMYPKEVLKNEHLPLEPFISSLDKIGRQLYWRGEGKVKEFMWFVSGKSVRYESLLGGELQKGDVKANIQMSLSVLQRYGKEYEPVVYYPVNEIQKVLGFYVAQVFIPKAFPLYLFEGYGTFDSDRLHDFALSKGFADFILNNQPHMFS